MQAQTHNPAVIAQRMDDLANRADVRQLAILLVAGLITPFQYVEKFTAIAEGSNLSDPTVLN